MGKKDPIPFQPRKRQRGAKTKSKSARRPPAPQGGETDEVREYWRHFFQHPFSAPARYRWTERMLWGNALLAALLTTIGTALESGFHFLLLISTFINVFFLFFLVYYLFPWVVDWILHQLKVRGAYVDAVKLEVIVLSGWLTIASLFRLIPEYSPWPAVAALAAFAVLTLFALQRRIRAPWMKTIPAWAGGVFSVAIITVILLQKF